MSHSIFIQIPSALTLNFCIVTSPYDVHIGCSLKTFLICAGELQLVLNCSLSKNAAPFTISKISKPDIHPPPRKKIMRRKLNAKNYLLKEVSGSSAGKIYSHAQKKTKYQVQIKIKKAMLNFYNIKMENTEL